MLLFFIKKQITKEKTARIWTNPKRLLKAIGFFVLTRTKHKPTYNQLDLKHTLAPHTKHTQGPYCSKTIHYTLLLRCTLPTHDGDKADLLPTIVIPQLVCRSFVISYPFMNAAEMTKFLLDHVRWQLLKGNQLWLHFLLLCFLKGGAVYVCVKKIEKEPDDVVGDG